MKYSEGHIDSYLRGEMTAEEKAEFEASLEQDPAMAREVDMLRLIVGGLKDRKEKLDSITAWHQEAENKALAKVFAQRPWMPWVTAFSAAAALVTCVFLFSPISSPVLPSGMENNPPVMRGTTSISEIDSLIEQGNLQDALNAIDTEIAETDSLLQESIRIRDEASYNVKKYEYGLRLLEEKKNEILTRQGKE